MTVNMATPYFSQRDNLKNPSGACNVTAIAMALAYLGYDPPDAKGQLEDWLYNKCMILGYSRHDPQGLKKLVEWTGHKDDLNLDASLEDIREALKAGKPCVVHGYSTGFGHVWEINGFGDRGFICNDPWGEWHPWWYDPAGGRDVIYSDRMIAACCGSWSLGQAMELYSSPSFKAESIKGIWLHVISREEG